MSISLSALDFCLLDRGAILTWTFNSEVNTPWAIPSSNIGHVYMHAAEMPNEIYIYIGSSGAERRRHGKSGTSWSMLEAQHPKLKWFKTQLMYVQKNDNPKPAPAPTPKNQLRKNSRKNPAQAPLVLPPSSVKLANDDSLRVAESQFILAFLLAHLNNWSFKHFSAPYPDSTIKTNWTDIDLKKLPDKPIRLINRLIIGQNYTRQQLEHLCDIPAVLLHSKMTLHYAWELDPLKYDPTEDPNQLD